MTAEELAKSIAIWVAENAEKESVFLTPVPTRTVDADDLLDHISSVSGIPKQQIGAWIDEHWEEAQR